jgi:hypothetical protein
MISFQINDDSSLNIKQAVLTVEQILTESRETMTTITTTWESWQQKVSSSRQFKSQWHQFIQDARKVNKRFLFRKTFFVCLIDITQVSFLVSFYCLVLDLFYC